MPKRKVTTIVTLEVKLKVPYKKSPGHVLQFVNNALTVLALHGSKAEDLNPELVSLQLIKKETMYG